MKKTFWIFLIFVFISPWSWVFFRNYRLLSLRNERSVCIQDPLFIERINILRGESQKAGFNLDGRLLVNKATFCFKDLVERYLESFDPHYLFFVGDLDLKKSTQNSGPLYVSFLPLILLGIFSLLKEKTKFAKKLFIILILSPLPSVFVLSHYESLSKFFLFLVLTFLASYGFWQLFSKKKFLAILLIFILLFEVARFCHDFFLHYPRKLEAQISNLQKR